MPRQGEGRRQRQTDHKRSENGLIKEVDTPLKNPPSLRGGPQEITGGRVEEDKVDDNDDNGDAPTKRLGTEYARTFAMVGG